MDFTTIARTASLGLLKAKQNSPTLMFVAGLVGVTSAAVLASKATLELDKTITPHLNHFQDINTVLSSDEAPNYGQSEAIKDRTIVMIQLVFDMGKLYGPAIAVGGLGIACLTGSHNILQKRNAAITAAYVGLEKSFNAYRARVAQEIGEEKEKELHYEVQSQLSATFDPEHRGFQSGGDNSVYGRWYNSQTTTEWKSNRMDNLTFVYLQQKFANDRLHRRGYLFLNEVLASLGLEVTDYGQVVGWVMKGTDGDKIVDFGIFDHHTDQLKYYAGGVNDEIYLDFNVDGLVADKLAINQRS